MLQRMSDDEILDLVASMEYSCEIDLVQDFTEGVTLEAIGSIIGITRERVRQIQRDAVDKLRIKAHMKTHEAYKDHRMMTYGTGNDDPYLHLLPNTDGMGDYRRQNRRKKKEKEASWELFLGNGAKPKRKLRKPKC